ncbi:MAG: methyl-accepting chemotaxis protein [Symploca sp. SIO1A3]|nr:methyl-accepting chemotaxis protein [Symploca sp. SIO1A3]
MFLKPFSKSTNQSKLQRQFLLLLLVSTIVPVSIVGLYGAFSSTSALSELAKSELEEEVGDKAKDISSFLEGIGDDVVFLSKTPSLEGIIRARAAGGQDQQGNSSYEASVEGLQTIMKAEMETHSFYSHFIYLNEKGQEMVRVDSEGNNIKIVPAGELQNKADSQYFIETMKLEAGKIYVSPVELNREQGQIEQPYKPVIHYALPIFDSAGKRQGIVVANVFANEFLKAAKELNLYEGEEGFIINQDGYFVSHPEPDKEWGFEFDKEETLASNFSDKLAEQVLSGEEEGLVEYKGNLIGYHKVDHAPDQPEFLMVINKVPKGEVFASVNSFKFFALLIVLVSLGAVLPLGITRINQLSNLIKELVSRISTSSQQTFSTLEEQERITNQQAASVNQTTITMDELQASSRQAAEQAQAAANAAQEALKMTKFGSEAVGETLQGMSTLAEKVGAIAEQIVRLSEQATQIGSISQLVSDVANQTNMLALNSSVEAVRAGEHGKGFAVVANEIRKLADQSQQSTEKINNLVAEIQNAINSTVMVTEEGTKTVATGVQIAQKTEQAFVDVEEAVNKVVLNNQQISLNLKQQVSGIQQVVQAMTTINQGAKQTATGINQTKLGTEQLNESAMELQEMV